MLLIVVKNKYSANKMTKVNKWSISQYVLNVELIEYETCSDLLLSSLQSVSFFQYSNNVMFSLIIRQYIKI